LSTETLHHIKKPIIFFTEVKRILKLGGLAVICEISFDTPIREIYMLNSNVCILGRIPPFTKILAALHGIPRREFKKGEMNAMLKLCFKDGYRVIPYGMLTTIVFSKSQFIC